jgi:excisionase family DNA binding protein
MSKDDALLNVVEAARRLGISPFGLYRRAQKGELPVVRIGRLLRFSEQDLSKWIEGKRQAARRSR